MIFAINVLCHFNVVCEMILLEQSFLGINKDIG